jgi:uncharacterized protein
MQESIKIIGREKEIGKLDKLLSSNQAEFLAIYGRRRVGKTFLIRQCFKNNLIFDFSGTKDVSITQQLSNFFEEYLSRTKGQRETKMPTSWHEAFRYLANFIKSESDLNPNQKLVVFIDEMPWIDTPKSEFISALEFFWNQHISKLDNVILVGCGSASSWIRKKLINARGGLYNRVTQRIKLMPFNLHETELFLLEKGIDFTRYQILELYMAMGGIPFYLNEIEKGKSATQSINEICFSRDGLLHDEYFQLYHSLFKNAENHIKIIETLASKPQGIVRVDLLNGTKISDASLSRALEELVECDFISIYQPFINKKKESIYKLTDSYSLFYLKFIKENKGNKSWEQLSNQNTYTAWSGYAFENICMQHIEQIKMALGISGIFTSTSSWKFKGNDELPGTQIDMLIDRADQVINLCEAKFTKDNFVITNSYSTQLKLKKSIFRQITHTKKAIFTTLLTTYPAIRNKYYLEEIQNEISMDKLFEK